MFTNLYFFSTKYESFGILRKFGNLQKIPQGRFSVNTKLLQRTTPRILKYANKIFLHVIEKEM